MRQARDEYYHLYNRGMQKQPIFENNSDRLRFLFTILTFQGEMVVKNVTRVLKQNVQSSTLHIDEELIKEVDKKRMVELVHFCLMPNHFHLIVRELTEDGISRYMQRILTAYTKYFNTRHEKSGHLFQGSYKSVHIDTDEQLMYLSSYIHKNPCELKGWKGREDVYYWSSYHDCLEGSRFGSLLKTDVITDRYEGRLKKSDYRKFVMTSTAKETI